MCLHYDHAHFSFVRFYRSYLQMTPIVLIVLVPLIVHVTEAEETTVGLRGFLKCGDNPASSDTEVVLCSRITGSFHQQVKPVRESV